MSGVVTSTDPRQAARQDAEVKTRLNSMTAFCRLPPEILARVLFFLQASPRTKPGPIHASHVDSGDLIDEDAFWASHNPRWVDVQLVCRLVRQVAVGTPELWTFIDCRGWRQPWIVWCLDKLNRAKDVPIIINGSGYGRAEHGHQAMVAANYLQRACAAKLTGSHFINTAILQQLLEQPLPSMRHLACVDWPSGVALTSRFFGGSCSGLQKLVLHGGSIEGDVFPSMPNLSHLELRNVCVDETLTHLVHLLRHAPHVRIFSIDSLRVQRGHGYFSTIGEDIDSVHHEAVALPELQLLYLRDTMPCITALMRILPLPKLSLSVLPRSGGFSGKDPAVPIPLTGRHLRVYGLMSDFLQATRTDGERLLPPSTISLETEVFSSPFSSGGTNIIVQLYIGTPLTSLQAPKTPHLHYMNRCRINGQDAILTYVTTMHLRSVRGNTHLHGTLPHAINDEEYGPSFLPAVRHVILEGVSNPVKEKLVGLEEWLNQRVLAGVRIDTLLLRQCHIDLEPLADGLCLRGLVDRVVVEDSYTST
jgi:hypothetical protein